MTATPVVAVIPGDVGFENYEPIERFSLGIQFWFAITLETPREMGWK